MVERRRAGAVKVSRAGGRAREGVSVENDVLVVITQAFCPNGHNLVRRNDVLFDGYPGVSVFVETEEWSGEVILSPIHGDHSKVGMSRSVPDGTRSRLKCPECEVDLPVITSCGCEKGGNLVAIYLRPDRSEGDVVGICNVLGCYRSRVLDNFEILSEFVEKDAP
jgi:hypothetical protein